MKKVRISIQETLKYQKQMVFAVNDNVTDYEINKALDKAEISASTADDVALILGNIFEGLEVLEIPYWNGPYDSEIEIDEYEIEED